jgi:hypothetical protein
LREWLTSLGLMAIAVGCSGSDPTTPEAGDTPGPGPDAPQPSECTASADLAAPLRRLTQLEYRNTASDLLGVELDEAFEFPADAIAGGFDNNAAVLNVSPLLAEKYLDAAEALSRAALLQNPGLVPCDPAATGEEACAQQFIERFGRRAYRRPLTAPETDRLMRAFTAGKMEGAFQDGIELVIQTALQSSAFLYRFEFGESAAAGQKLVRLTQHELASRLSYFLWGSMPSDALLAAADAGQLATPEQLATQARQMLDDARARRAVAEFYRQWLGVSELENLKKDTTAYPEYTPALAAAMAAELPAFIEHVIWSADRSLTTLLTAPIGFVSAAPLAEVYGVAPPTESGATQVALDPAQRGGVLTQAGVLAVHALPNQSSPVARGKFVRESLLCQLPSPPPANLNVTPPEVDPNLSTRERFAQHTESAECAGCHELMDPLGFAFESYDAVGRYRDTEAGKPIDTSGWISGSTDVDGPFQNARELASKLASSQQVRDCVATQWFRYAFGRHEGPADACALAKVQADFTATSADLRELLVSLTQSESFLHRKPISAEELAP